MIKDEKVIVLDVDGTLCKIKQVGQDYLEVEPNDSLLTKVKDLHSKGYYIILFTSRQMRTYEGNIGKINAKTAKNLFEWLEKHDIPYDEIHFGKPWCGKDGFYVDDKAIRPKEFEHYSLEEIHNILKRDSYE
ncbi:capsular biosynthesis protein [Ureibacillus chungkukjangi]|uniref:capsular biosynthesis protein n=1 Tax=Ureibacillus chungkukjangi TaxID=1202712 RepID=UPI00384AED02